MRASGNDLGELFGYAPDDTSTTARQQWKTRECPFVEGQCVKHSHPPEGAPPIVFGSCSVLNRLRNKSVEEVIICPQRMYADGYATLKRCAADAGITSPMYLASEYAERKKARSLHPDHCVFIGKNSGREVSLSNRGVIDMSLDWVLAYVDKDALRLLVPCEVQSIDTTGNYQANWQAYARERAVVPDSEHGMNWANVWKRLIPQLILKAAIASTSKLCTKGTYFVVPTRVYAQFQKIVGVVTPSASAGPGVLSVMTYDLGPVVPKGQIRSLVPARIDRMLATEFAKEFASGKQLPLGSQLDQKVAGILAAL